MGKLADLRGHQVFTVDEAATLLRVHPEHVRRLIRGGEIKAAKIGRLWTISRPDLDAFYQSRGGGRLFD